ncbi:MAG: proteasome assembly chaperone family protein [Candidatus Heimdallarchaeota archaeon]|nr:proteasome assembly chaperone family protein [Candidatus Heimdallarchaeota archaeon]
MDKTTVRVEQSLPIDANGKIIIQAFTGSGLVGSLVSHHLIDNLKLKEKGYITSKLIPAIGIVRKGIIQRPVRVFENESYVLVLAEVGIPQDDINEFIEGLFNWYIEQDPASIIIVGALPTGRPADAIDLKYTLVSSNALTRDFLEQKGLRISQKSAVYGSVAISLMEASKTNISAMAILPHCIPSVPDYLAAKKVIEILSHVLDVEIPVSPLDINAIELKEHLIRRKKFKESVDLDDDEEDDDDDYDDDFLDDLLDLPDEDDDYDLSKFK